MPLQLRHGTAAAWTANNRVLEVGRPGFETDTGRVKIGDGATAWNDLDYLDAFGRAAIGDGIYRAKEGTTAGISGVGGYLTGFAVDYTDPDGAAYGLGPFGPEHALGGRSILWHDDDQYAEVLERGEYQVSVGAQITVNSSSGGGGIILEGQALYGGDAVIGNGSMSVEPITAGENRWFSNSYTALLLPGAALRVKLTLNGTANVDVAYAELIMQKTGRG